MVEERLRFGNFERILFVMFLGLVAAVINLGVNLRAAPSGAGDVGYVAYDSPITDNLFTVQEIKPLELLPVSEPAVQAAQPVSEPVAPTPVTQQQEQIKHTGRETTRSNTLNKLL